MRSLLSAVIIAAAFVAVPAHAQIVDESTGTQFEATTSVAGTTYKCLGAGVRKVFFIKAYAVAFCVEGAGFPAATKSYVEGKRAAAGSALGEQLGEDPQFFSSLVENSGGKLVIMKLVRDISAERMAKAFKEKLSQVLPPDKVQKLIATIPGDAKEGQMVQIYSANGKLTIDMGGGKKTIDDAEIAQKIWYAWLGADGASPTLKKSLGEHAAK